MIIPRRHQRSGQTNPSALADHDAVRQTPLDFRSTKRTRINADKTLTQHTRARSQIRAQTHTLSLRDLHTRRHNIINHSRQLIDRIHVNQSARTQRRAHKLEIIRHTRTLVRPHHRLQQVKHPVHVDLLRTRQAVRQKMQTQIHIVGITRRLSQRRDRGAHRHLLDHAILVELHQRQHLGTQRMRTQTCGASNMATIMHLSSRQHRGVRKPRIQHRSIQGDIGNTNGGSPKISRDGMQDRVRRAHVIQAY